jgi:hypothetical protein
MSEFDRDIAGLFAYGAHLKHLVNDHNFDRRALPKTIDEAVKAHSQLGHDRGHRHVDVCPDCGGDVG